MAREIVVLASPLLAYRRLLSYSSSSIVVLGVASRVARDDCRDWFMWPDTSVLLLIIVLALSCYILATKCASNGNEMEVAVVVYPLGIQQIIRKKGEPYKLERAPYFIPRDRIVDCVVNERILAHKVESVVLLRLREEQAQVTKGGFALVEAFPSGAHMSYTDCLSRRSEIMIALEQTTASKEKNPAHY
jgi:hypothetical protein